MLLELYEVLPGTKCVLLFCRILCCASLWSFSIIISPSFLLVMLLTWVLGLCKQYKLGPNGNFQAGLLLWLMLEHKGDPQSDEVVGYR